MHESDLNRAPRARQPSTGRLATCVTRENRLHECYRANRTETPDQQCSFGTLSASAGDRQPSIRGPIQRAFSQRVSGACVRLPGKHLIVNNLSGGEYALSPKPDQSMLRCMKGTPNPRRTSLCRKDPSSGRPPQTATRFRQSGIQTEHRRQRQPLAPAHKSTFPAGRPAKLPRLPRTRAAYAHLISPASNNESLPE
jgi:hypothetical protein